MQVSSAELANARRSPIVGPVMASVVVIALLLFVAWLPQPRSLSYGDRVQFDHLDVGKTFVAEMGDVRGRSITVRTATPIVKQGSAAIAIDVFVCHTKTANYSVGYTEGWDEVRQECRSIQPARGAHLSAHNRDRSFDEFVVAVTPLMPGPIMVNGLRVTHSGWWRDTTERSGVQLAINATDP